MTPILNLRKSQPSTAAHLHVRHSSKPDLEAALLLACLALLAIALLGPSLEQPGHYHAFADRRALFGIPNLMDVLSNLAFAGFGALGLWRLWRIPRRMPSIAQLRLARLFFFGLVATALFSSGYHLKLDDAGLAIDRYGMTIAFAGLLGLAVSTRISDRAGQWLALAVLACGASSIWTWSATGNVLPWVTLQFGGMALMLGLGCLPARSNALPVSWIAVIVLYALAKVLEQADVQVYHLTGQWISGHTLKHVVASLAALPVLAALAHSGRP